MFAAPRQHTFEMPKRLHRETYANRFLFLQNYQNYWHSADSTVIHMCCSLSPMLSGKKRLQLSSWR